RPSSTRFPERRHGMKKLCSLLLLVAALPLAAQRGPGGPGGPPGGGPPGQGPGGPGGPGGGPPPEVVLKEVLGLTEAQLSSIRTLAMQGQQTVQPIPTQP